MPALGVVPSLGNTGADLSKIMLDFFLPCCHRLSYCISVLYHKLNRRIVPSRSSDALPFSTAQACGYIMAAGNCARAMELSKMADVDMEGARHWIELPPLFDACLRQHFAATCVSCIGPPSGRNIPEQKSWGLRLFAYFITEGVV